MRDERPDPEEQPPKLSDRPVLTETVRDPEAGGEASDEIPDEGEPPGGENFA